MSLMNLALRAVLTMDLEYNNRVFIGLGSNLNDSPAQICQAIRLLEEHFGAKMIASSLYFSEPVEVRDQPWYYNQVVYFQELFNECPSMVLKKLKEIEQIMGRVPIYRYGPRIIDLDLLIYKDWVFESDSLIIPHPKMNERLFVIAPLFELAPELIHPRCNLSIGAIMKKNSSKFSRCEKVPSTK
ncbi:MAG TPA: 2-amino-4-hydroxy-6-hydroxymethyldihydropteridine diphosphokinase [Firmicutes bacterium]|nr:2-amino-4-hydroxy-6-hydroxymethyldihydropteridine diphosphokinase [Bacillota bacterium]